MWSRVLLPVFVGVLLGAVCAEAQTELFVADLPDSTGCCVVVHGRTASGNAPPLRTLAGPRGAWPWGLAVELVHDELFVSGNSSVTVYSRTASGSTAPLRTLQVQGPATGVVLSSAVALDLTNDELFVASYDPRVFRGDASTITVYGRTASGNAAPLRTLQGPATGLVCPADIVLDLGNDELIVANQCQGLLSGGQSITVYSRTASGNAAPLRTIQGPATRLESPSGVALDVFADELFVADFISSAVHVYGRTANGDVAPLRTLGPAAGLFPRGVTVDAGNDELIVVSNSRKSSVDPDPVTAIDVYRRNASDNVAPLRAIQGPATGITNPHASRLTPKLDLLAVVNQARFFAGETLGTKIGAVNPGLPGTADAYIGILRPDSTIQFFTGEGSVIGHANDLASFVPIASGVPLTTPFSATVAGFSDHQWTLSDQPGDYLLFFVAVTARAIQHGAFTGQVLAFTSARFAFTLGDGDAGR